MNALLVDRDEFLVGGCTPVFRPGHLSRSGRHLRARRYALRRRTRGDRTPRTVFLALDRAGAIPF